MLRSSGVEEMFLARRVSVAMMPLLTWMGWQEEKWIYWSVWGGLANSARRSAPFNNPASSSVMMSLTSLPTFPESYKVYEREL